MSLLFSLAFGLSSLLSGGDVTAYTTSGHNQNRERLIFRVSQRGPLLGAALNVRVQIGEKLPRLFWHSATDNN
jgi:hypothetical protein